MEKVTYEDGYTKEIVHWETTSGKPGHITVNDPPIQRVWEGDHLQPTYQYRFEEDDADH